METIVEMNGVSKQFKDKKAVDSISFSIAKGTITAILGPNGAGKTTSLSMMLGLTEPSAGTVRIFGQDPRSAGIRERTGAMLQEVSVMDRLKVHEIISLIRSFYRQPMEMDTLLQVTGLAPADLNRYSEKLSGGQKRSLGFALALAGDPDLLFLDEPTVGLDTTARRRFWDTVRGLARQGKTILFTTHYLQEVEDVADRVLLFNHGKLVAEGSPNEIKAAIVKQSVSFRTPSDPADYERLRQHLLKLGAVSGCTVKDGRMHALTEDTDRALQEIFAAGLPVQAVLVEQGNLDEAFEQLTMEHEEAVQ